MKRIDTFAVLNNYSPAPGAQYPTYTGSDGNDFVIATAQGTSSYLIKGDDVFVSLAYGTFADMGDGDDTAFGWSSGCNSFIGGNGNDYLAVAGGDGNYLDGGAGSDSLYGGWGHDTIMFDASDKVVFGGGGSDFFRLNPYIAGGVASISDFDGSSPNHDVLDLSLFGGLAKEDLMLVGFDADGGQLLYVDGNEAFGRPPIALVGIHFDGGIDGAIASGALVLWHNVPTTPATGAMG